MLSKKEYLKKKAALKKAIIAKYGMYTTTTYKLYMAHLHYKGK